MHAGDARAVAGDPDVPHEALVTGGGHRLHHTTRPVGDLPLLRLHEVVELDQVDRVHLEALQRPLQLSARGVLPTLPRLGGQEEAMTVLGHPRTDAQLGLPVAGGGVEVVDPGVEEHLQHLVGPFLAQPAQGGRPEDHAGAGVAGAAEGCSGDHAPNLRPSSGGRRGFDSAGIGQEHPMDQTHAPTGRVHGGLLVEDVEARAARLGAVVLSYMYVRMIKAWPRLRPAPVTS